MGAERRAGREVEGVMDRTTEQRPAGVPTGAIQAGEIRARWAWVEPTVWTERMLTALEQGVKGGKWFSLMDKVYAMPNLWAAFAKVRASAGAAGVDRETVKMFEQHLEPRLWEIRRELEAGAYQWGAYRRFRITDPKPREIRAAPFRDRVVHHALVRPGATCERVSAVTCDLRPTRCPPHRQTPAHAGLRGNCDHAAGELAGTVGSRPGSPIISRHGSRPGTQNFGSLNPRRSLCMLERTRKVQGRYWRL